MAKENRDDAKNERIREMVDDILLQARTPGYTGDESELTVKLREMAKARDYEGILKILKDHPNDVAANLDAAVAYRELGDMKNSLYHSVRGLGLADPKKDGGRRRSLALNLIALRIRRISGDFEVPLLLARLSWKTFPFGRYRSWCAITTQAEIILDRANKLGLDMNEAISEVDALFAELQGSWPEWFNDQDFINYCWRSLDLTLYRDSKQFKARFANTRPR
jgi:hypothetical protein